MAVPLQDFTWYHLSYTLVQHPIILGSALRNLTESSVHRYYYVLFMIPKYTVLIFISLYPFLFLFNCFILFVGPFLPNPKRSKTPTINLLTKKVLFLSGPRKK